MPEHALACHGKKPGLVGEWQACERLRIQHSRAAALFRIPHGLVADRAHVRRARDGHGPDSVGMFSCSKATNEVNYVAQKFMRVAIGTNNIDSCNRT